MDTWSTVALEEIYAEPSRNGLTRPKRVRGSGHKMINMGEIFAHDRIRNPPMDLVLMNESEKEKYSVKVGDLLFARQSLVAAGAGKCSIVLEVPETTTFESHLIRIRLEESRVSPLFYYYYFSSPLGKGNMQSLVMQVAAAGIRGSELAKLKVPYPPLPTQRKIASVLSAYDDLIENNTRRIKTLEEMAQAIYREWFVNFRFPGHEKARMVDSPLGQIPEGWEVTSLQEVCTRITDGSHWSPKTVDDGFPMASVKDMHTWGFHIDQCRKISREDYEELVRNDCKPLQSDVLVAKDGSYLKHIFVVDDERDIAILSSIALLRPSGRILPHVLSFYLLEPEVKSRMAGYVSGVAVPRIVLKDFRKFPIVAPPLDIQKRFLDLTEPMIRDCQLLMKKNTNLRHTRDLLLPKLISGEVNVEDLDVALEATEPNLAT